MKIEDKDIQGPNLIACLNGDTGKVGFDLEWNVLVPKNGIDKFIDDNGEVTIIRRMTREEAQEWISILKKQLTV